VTAAAGSKAKLIVTDAANRAKLNELPDCPPVLLVDRGAPGSHSFAMALAAQPAAFAPVKCLGDDPFVTLFTSGTTGNPKCIRYSLHLLLAAAAYMREGLDLRPSDRYWNVADPGWAYGMLYGIMGPLLLGHATTMYEGPFAVDSTVRMIAQQHITNLTADPTVYRLMMAAGDEAMAPIAGQLRVASSAGEPLNPEVASAY
jgi:acetyl-CoA synthetase